MNLNYVLTHNPNLGSEGVKVVAARVRLIAECEQLRQYIDGMNISAVVRMDLYRAVTRRENLLDDHFAEEADEAFYREARKQPAEQLPLLRREVLADDSLTYLQKVRRVRWIQCQESNANRWSCFRAEMMAA